MRIIRQRHEIIDMKYAIEFANVDGSGYSFPATANGRVLEELMSDEALSCYYYCLSHQELFEEPAYFTCREYKHIIPAIGECICGNEMELTDDYMGACQCSKCGRWYNLFGQKLLSPDHWKKND